MSWVEDWVWPKVDSRRRAQNAIEEGFWASTYVSVLGFLILLIAVMKDPAQFDPTYFLGAVVFAVVAFGIRRRSRAAAFAGLILYVAERIYVLLFLESLSNFVLPILITLALLNAVRGTLAYHRFPQLPANLPTVEQSLKAMGNPSSRTEADKAADTQ